MKPLFAGYFMSLEVRQCKYDMVGGLSRTITSGCSLHIPTRAPSRAVTRANQTRVLAAGLQGQGLSCLAIGDLPPHDDQSLGRPPSNAMPTSFPRSTATNTVITLLTMRRPLTRRQAPCLDVPTSMPTFHDSFLVYVTLGLSLRSGSNSGRFVASGTQATAALFCQLELVRRSRPPQCQHTSASRPVGSYPL